MTVATLIAASFSFTATATGVAKGTPVEFMFAGKGSDRDYETMFVLDISPEDFCNGIEKAGIPRGNPPDTSNCVLWPVGCPLTLEPSLDDFVERQFEAGCPAADTPILYTGGTRRANGRPALPALCKGLSRRGPLRKPRQ